MTSTTIDGFDYRRIGGAGRVSLNVAVAGGGHPIVLLHGFPQTHLMWRRVARILAEQYLVVVPDLRGYGAERPPL